MLVLRLSAGFEAWRRWHWILGASRTGLYFGTGCGVGGRADSILVPPTLTERWALNTRLPAKAKTVLGVLGSQEYIYIYIYMYMDICIYIYIWKEKTGYERMPASKTQDSADMPLRMTFGSHVETTCDASSFKATWFPKVIFTGISALSRLFLAGRCGF